jgi:hypothetical protein
MKNGIPLSNKDFKTTFIKLLMCTFNKYTIMSQMHIHNLYNLFYFPSFLINYDAHVNL